MPKWVVRQFEPQDDAAVKAIWRDGFMDMAWDFTRTLAPLVPFVPATRPFRPLAVGITLAGLARAGVALARNESRNKLATAAGIAAGGISALLLFHLAARRGISKMCDEACNAPTGDMFNIEKSWVKAPGRAFFVATDPATGAVVGTTAVSRGGIRDMMQHTAPASGAGAGAGAGAAAKDLTEPDACSVWKVSTSKESRGKGVAKVLMDAAERWAAEKAGAKRMVLVTASPGAKSFYKRIGYRLSGGTMRGAEISFWEKALYL